MKKTHYYLDNQVTEDDGYGKTACGRDGRKVGGMIKFFFRVVKQRERCKICDKQFRKEDDESRREL